MVDEDKASRHSASSTDPERPRIKIPTTPEKPIAPIIAQLNEQASNKLSHLSDRAARAVASMLESTFDFNSPRNRDLLQALTVQLSKSPALSRPSDYDRPDSATGPYSSPMTTTGDYFRHSETEIASFDELHSAISQLIEKTAGLPLVWRGAKNSEWGMHSHLYRHLMKANKVRSPQSNPQHAQNYPDEDQLIQAEKNILDAARSDWRFDDLPALELFARIQHAGGPTRLLDVTKNPYIAAWFAVEFDPEHDDHDARIFALATRPVTQNGKPEPLDHHIQLDGLGGSRDPFWHALADTSARQQLDWGTGARRRLWTPPAYVPRISAQNAAFVLDGVPITSSRTAPYFSNHEGGYWRRADLLASASVYVKMLKADRKPQYSSRNFAPTFNFRILASAKASIRKVMEDLFGYKKSYIYPDVAALSEYVMSIDLSKT